MASFEILKGLTFKSIIGMVKDSEEIQFISTCGREFILFHNLDCCESVRIESVVGDVNDLIDSEILMAEESTGETPNGVKFEPLESYTWTFYKLATIKGYIDIRWLGESNGYYSEKACFIEVIQEI